MKKRKIFLLTGTAALLMALTACSSSDKKEEAVAIETPMNYEVIIAHMNDTHGRVKEGKYDGMGFARVSTVVKDLKANEENVLFLDAGDTFHGTTFATLSQGESIVRLLNAMKLDALSPGNHDFNYGKERLKELEDMAEFDVVSANVIDEDGDYFFNPYVIKEMEGVRVGIFGLATPETAYKTNPKNVEGLTFGSPAEYAAKTVAKLKEEGAQLIVAVCHLGIDESTLEENQSIGVVKAVDGIDILVDGHSHTALKNGMIVNDTMIVQTGEYDKNFGVVRVSVSDGIMEVGVKLITKAEAMGRVEKSEVVVEEAQRISAVDKYSVKSGDTLTKIAANYDVPMSVILEANADISNANKIYVNDEIMIPVEKEVVNVMKKSSTRVVPGIPEDPEIVKLITEIEQEQMKITEVEIGTTPVTLDGERDQVRRGETNLGNLITDSMLWETGADIAITNGGGIRASIEKGTIKVGDVITVLPFGNYVITKKVSGQDIIDAIEHGISDYPATKGAFPHVAGIRVTFDEEKPAGSRVVEIKTSSGEKIDPDREYTLATNDFMAAGGDDYLMFKDRPQVGNFEGLDEILKKYVEENGITQVKTDGRMTVID